ncbi:nSTAND1 domain-containing NTPase [Nitrospirillum viridazoti]|uniref:nSTAND1 domain-containing NTPase n=2 Tax=Nitrospirillum viridazoti TaxID=3144925 RepID=UPI0024823A64|nr:winged helix-turn-helix domain-containing protein [Nitrospirillum amazonense]
MWAQRGEELQTKSFHFGEWLVDAQTCTLRQDQGSQESAPQTLKVEPRAMDVLLALCERSGQILSADDLLHLCWDGLAVGENQVHKAITQLRKLLGDTAGDPRYIENIRKRGYRTVAAVTPVAADGKTTVLDMWIDTSPFVGLDAFDERHAAVFFGRDTAIAQLRATVAAQIAGGHDLVLILGPSGSGKTSLVQAGLIPSLRSQDWLFPLLGTSVLDLGDVQDIPLPLAIGGALLDLEVDGRPLLQGLSADAIGTALAGVDRPLFLDEAIGPPRDGRAILFIDRLEAVFHDATVGEAQRQQFFTALGHLARSGHILVIAACRNDFYPDVAGEPLLMAAKARGGHFDLGPPTRAEIIHMIRLPAIVAGLRFGTDPETGERLDDMLCDAAADQPDALPLLQYTLHELYLQRSTSRELTIAGYRALGGLGGAIGRRADATLEGLPATSRAALSRVLSLVVTVGASDEAARSRRIPWSALATPEEQTLVDTFVRQRLFVSQVYDGEPVFGVAHEAMLRQWPRATAWIADHRRFLKARSRMEEAAKRWTAEGRRVDLLLPRGQQLEEARELADFAPIPLDAGVRAYIDASAARARQAERRRLVAMASFAVIAVVAGTLGLVARRAEKAAEQRKHQAVDLMNFMVGNFADKLRPLGRLDLLSDIGEKALSYFSQENLSSLTAEDRNQQARALQTLAEVARSRGDPKSAQVALARAKSLLDTNLAEGLESQELLKDLGADAFWMGQISLDQRDVAQAETFFRDYERYSQRMVALAPDDVDAWIELSYARTNLGSAAQARGDTQAARTLFESSLALKRRALERRPDNRSLRSGIANTLSWLGSAHEAEGELREALSFFGQEKEQFLSLRAAAPSELLWTFRLVTSLYRRARLLYALGDLDTAAEELDQALILIQDLMARDASNQLWQQMRIKLRVLTAEILNERQKFDEALAILYANAGTLAQITAQGEGSAEWQLAETGNQFHVAGTLLRMGRANESAHVLQSALDKLRIMPESRQQDLDYRQQMARGLFQMAMIHRTKGQDDLKEKLCEESLPIARYLIDKNPNDYYNIDTWIRINLCLGNKMSVGGYISTLDKIGYRDPSYLLILSQFEK